MADKIRLLPEIVANQIAAGEVVNRPASVVKEMMENAIDAGARCVKVNFRDGGKDLIQVVDDGCGMSPIDARMAFDRHATSKIRTAEDIYSLHTFGFRGEALASIAAVAQVELRTRQEGDEVGTRTEINGGQFASQTPAMCPVGSQFFVRNLFYNVPARRRFLDRSTASATQIRTEFQRVALCNPQIAFELYANDAPVYVLGAASQAGRIVDVVGRHIKHNLLEVDADTSIARLSGFIGRPAAAKRRNAEQYLFVNGRYFKSAYLASAIMKAYEKLIPENAQPAWFLYLTIDPGRIDVNVHPQKIEVKFADEEAVWQIVNAAVRETLAKTGAVPMMDFDRKSPVEIPVLRKGAVYSEPRAMSNSDYNPFREEYIDPTAPDPNVDFTGFDVPWTDGGQTVADASSAGVRAAGRGKGGLRSAGFPSVGPGLQPDPWSGSDAGGRPDAGLFEEFVSGGNAVAAGDSGSEPEGGAAADTGDPAAERASAAEPVSGADFSGGVFASGGFILSDAPGPAERMPAAEPGEEPEGEPEEDDGRLCPWRRLRREPQQRGDASCRADVPERPDISGAEDPDESGLDFLPSASDGEQQRLEIAEQPEFTDALPLGGGYVAALLNGRFVVADVRRARERILYEEYLRMMGSGASVSQQLLFPERLVVSLDEYALLEEHAVEFAALGFDLDFCGGGAVEVKGSPADLPADSVDRILFELLQAFSMPVPLEDVRREKIAATMACGAARKAPKMLAREEAAALLSQLAAAGNISFSPSGKAILAEITPEEIRAKLG